MWWAMIYPLIPGVILSTRLFVAEALAAALLLVAVDSFESGRPVRALLAAGYAVWVRPFTVLPAAVVGWFVWRQWRRIWPVVGMVGAWGVWAVTLLVRFGWEAPVRTTALPFVGWVEAWPSWFGPGRADDLLGGLILVGVSIGALALCRRNPLRMSAAAWVVVVPLLGVEALSASVNSHRWAIYPIAVVVVVLRPHAAIYRKYS